MKEYLLRDSVFDRSRKLILTPEFVEYESPDFLNEGNVRLLKEHIVDIKHGVDLIEIDLFSIGRTFTIAFKSKDESVLKVRFKKYFYFNKRQWSIYSQIVDDLWAFYLKDIVDRYLIEFYDNKRDVEIAGIKFMQDGISFGKSHPKILWEEVSFKQYFRHFDIFKTDDPSIHKVISFNEWNSEVLFSLIRTIRNERSGQQKSEN